VEPKVRPISITTFDLLAILVPGFVWLFLIVTTVNVFSSVAVSTTPPIAAWNQLMEFVTGQSTWFPPVALILGSLLVGYTWRPYSMTIATYISRLLLKLEKKYRHIPLRRLTFPFTAIFEDKPYYQLLMKEMESVLRIAPDKLYGSGLFAVARRYFWLNAPALSEYADRREAEVRMTGQLFLGALYSAILSALVILKQMVCVAGNPVWSGMWYWLAISFVGALIFASGFNRMRVSEVAAVYTSFLVALRYQPDGQGVHGRDSTSDEDD
jgi:hypothetical protein